ncbi:MAG TPA: hypothetical protein VH331_00930 [Allosphingosinicella sp.]|jgi:hypothetical protein|nr:hypothetical protein [Allosphingosinicella sp.]
MDKSPYEYQAPFVPIGAELPWDMKAPATGPGRPKPPPTPPRRPGLY